jgi:hypothetical protein
MTAIITTSSGNIKSHARVVIQVPDMGALSHFIGMERKPGGGRAAWCLQA